LILDTLVEESTPVRVQNLSTNADGFVWILDGEPFANQASPGTVPGTFAGVHRVQLVALRAGCPDTATATFRVEEVLLDLPNAFSPNGDGVNDIFRLRYQGLQRLEVLIFDRWGLQVFGNGGNPTLEWTGEFNGKPCPEDVYAVRATATSLGGRTLEKVGTITLIR
jgi:gliding motility-associated-like protein